MRSTVQGRKYDIDFIKTNGSVEKLLLKGTRKDMLQILCKITGLSENTVHKRLRHIEDIDVVTHWNFQHITVYERKDAHATS